jgi:hypothetical protein
MDAHPTNMQGHRNRQAVKDWDGHQAEGLDSETLPTPRSNLVMEQQLFVTLIQLTPRTLVMLV